ncbi:hypothetical protein [Massilia antarctica]|uniref:hypothetical protein n=1 Tax=Massilia antarctica TaxID=2765360 RepID=UPI001E334A8E|nr:hypothetical protein [Massilia antarctica]
MEWAGYLSSIVGLMAVLLTFDRPGWMWQAGGAVAVLIGISLIYFARHRRSDGYGGGRDIADFDDIGDALDGD